MAVYLVFTMECGLAQDALMADQGHDDFTGSPSRRRVSLGMFR